MGRLEGRVAVVVGVGSAIGRACALRLAAEGATVLCADPDASVADEVRDDVIGAGGQALSARTDFASEADAESLAQTCLREWGSLDVLVNCGAAMDHWPVEEDSIARWEDVLRTNLLGPLVYTQALRPLLERSAAGSVVYLSSVDGLLGNPTVPAYSVSKGGLVPLTHVMAHACAPHGIRVNALATAAIVQTGPGAPAPQRASTSLESVLTVTPLRRLPSPDEIAGVVLFYASDDSSFVTGTVLPVDGGRLAITPGTG